MAWVIGDLASLHATMLSDSIALWEQPGTGEGRGSEITRLPHAQRVVVVETDAAPNGLWLRVRPVDRLEPIGWVPVTSAIRTVGSRSSRPERLPGSPAWGVQVAAGGGGVGPSELNTEYSRGAFRVGAQYMRFLSRRRQWGAGIGLRQATGTPRVLYLTPGTVEEPMKSRLWMLDLGVRGGQRFGRGSGLRFDWLIGPTLTYVHERADLSISDATTNALILTRDESLGRWAGGGDLRLSFGRANSRGLEIGLVSDVYLMGWRGQRTRSLSTDFVRSSIHGFDLALALTFPGR